MVAQAGSTSSSAAITTCAVVRDQVEQRAEAIDGKQLGDVGPVLVGGGRDLRQLAVLGRELGGGRDLDPLGLAQAALGERGEPAQRLDLDVEQVDADGTLLGRRVDVEQPAADRELAALLDLVDALVAGRDEVDGGLLEVEQVADFEREACGRSSGSGTFSDSATALTITTGCSLPAGVSVSASSAATRRPTRCGGGVRCDS